MFQFSGSPFLYLLIQYRMTEYCSAGFPHSEICGSIDICSSPQLIAACHVLLRLLMPRHSPCALPSLTFVSLSFKRSLVLLAFPYVSKSSLACSFSSSLSYPSLSFRKNLLLTLLSIQFSNSFSPLAPLARFQFPLKSPPARLCLWLFENHFRFSSFKHQQMFEK